MKAKYNRRTWLNSNNADGTSSVVAFDGVVKDYHNKKVNDRWLEIADCRNKIRLHQTTDDTKNDFISKIKILHNEIGLFIKHLEK